MLFGTFGNYFYWLAVLNPLKPKLRIMITFRYLIASGSQINPFQLPLIQEFTFQGFILTKLHTREPGI